MQFPNIEDEDGDFNSMQSTAARSRLSSLFQPTERASGDVNQALTFTAPKQPKKNDNTQSNQGTLKLIHTAVVHAYKLIDGNYTTQGKLGCAILGLPEANNFKLLLYKGKQVQVCTTAIVPTFQFHVQPNNYATFYDEKNENWSINFDSESALLNFAKQIALTKFNSQEKSQVSLIVQDLVQGDGPSLDAGDAAEVKYTGWLLSNYTFGQVFDSNMTSESAFRLRLGKKVIKGWSEGLVGAQKGTRRLLVVPPHLAYGSEGMGNAVPSNSTLIFEICVTKVKVSRDSSHSPSPMKVVENVPEKKPEVMPRHSISGDDNIRLRGASISEQLSQSPKKDKAQLISRMAKMGTATLPFQGAIPAQVNSDSENEEEVQQEKPAPPVPQSGSRTSSPKPLSRPNSRKNSEHAIVTQPVQLQSVQESSPFHVSQQPSPVPFYPQTILPNQQPYGTPINAYPPFQPQMTNQYQMPQAQYAMPGMMPTTSIADTHLPMLMTETRSQNTEVRLSLSKITDKVETVIQKIDDLRLNQGRSGGLSHAPFMDSAMLVQSIEKIVQENSQLKEDSEAKGAKIQSLNEKICDLLQRNQRFFEESNSMLEQRSDSLQAVSTETQTRLFSLEREKSKLAFDLSEALSKLGSMESELVTYRNHESELRQKLQEGEKTAEGLTSELNSLRKKSDSESENSSLINLLRNEIQNLEEDRTRLNSQMKNWEEQFHVVNKYLSEKTKELEDLQEQINRNQADTENSSNTQHEAKIVALKTDLEKASAEKDQAAIKCESLQTKLSTSQRSESLLKERMILLQNELQSSLAYKEKYEIFYQKTRQLKESYENQVQTLMAELKQARSSLTSTNSPDFSGEIKKVMNVLYKLLQGKFEPGASYTGNQILETTLQAIRGLTFQMLQRKEQKPESTTKESDTVNPLENTVLNTEVSTTESLQTEIKAAGGGDNYAEVTSTIQENGVLESAPLNNNIPSETNAPFTEPTLEDVSAHLSVDTKDKTVVNNKVQNSSIDQSLENNIDMEKPSQGAVESTDHSNSQSETNEKNKTETRISPDHSQQPSSTNISHHSLSNSGNSKVLDGPSQMHA